MVIRDRNPLSVDPLVCLDGGSLEVQALLSLVTAGCPSGVDRRRAFLLAEPSYHRRHEWSRLRLQPRDP